MCWAAAPLCLPNFTWRTPVPDSRQTAFLLLVSGNLIRLEAVSGSVALAVGVDVLLALLPQKGGSAGLLGRI
jgi:hypothetical protein